MSFRSNFDWAQRFMPEVKRHLGPLLLTESSFEQDTMEATDLIVLKARDMRVGVRIRRPGYERFKDDFTIRYRSKTGTPTEMAKIVDGWGDWLFYAHASEDDCLATWMVIDLDVLRAMWIKYPLHPALLNGGYCGIRKNGDGTELAWFRITDLPRSDVLVARQEPPTTSILWMFG